MKQATMTDGILSCFSLIIEPQKVPSTPVLPSVDCTVRKRQRVEKALQQIPLPRTDEDSADPILQDAKRAYYESGTAYFEEARQYYARLNEDIKKYDEWIVLVSMYASMNSETEDDYIERQNFYWMYYYCLGFNFTSLNVPTM